MPVHTWIHKVVELLTPSFIKKAQYDQIRNAINEIQLHALTNVTNSDGTLSVEVREGEAIVNSNTEGVQNQLVLRVVTSITWSDPVLSYIPINVYINNGKITYIETLASVTIDTAEACA